MAVPAHGLGGARREPAHRPDRGPGGSPPVPHCPEGAGPVSCRPFISPGESGRARAARQRAARLDEEEQQASKQTQQAEARNEAGVYVYALPHYIRHPYDQASGRTLLKVGRSDSDVIVRFRSQARTTALPEEPILLRIYRTSGDSVHPPRQPSIAC